MLVHGASIGPINANQLDVAGHRAEDVRPENQRV